MKNNSLRWGMMLLVSVATTSLMMKPSTATAAFADLSGWTGFNNTAGNNNYTLTSQTSAGGVFQERVTGGAYLADTFPAGTVNDTMPFSATGTITFDSSGNPGDITNPAWFLGFFDSTNLQDRVYGLAFGDQAANQFRIQASVGSGDVVSGGGTVLGDGTYPFSIAYDPSIGGGTLSVLVNSVGQTVTGLAASLDNFSGFGFLQRGTTDTATFSVSISDINYTGNTLVPEPSSFVLLALGAIGISNLARRRKTHDRRITFE